MFANPVWSLLVLVVLAILYGIVRYKHGGPLLANNERVRDWKTRWWARIVAWRSWIATAISAILIAAPDLIVLVAPVDLSPFIGPKWAPIVSGSLAAFLAINNLLKTKPVGEKAA